MTANNRLPGLDYLRVFAMLLVTYQHGLSAAGWIDATRIHEISVGQLGVSIFCAISGWLAFGHSAEPAWDWLWKRLRHLFPGYWVAILLSFFVTFIFDLKPITWGLFFSQLLGLGYFTHGWELVNVVSWFVSLILLCYMIALVARVSGYMVPFLVIVVLTAGLLLVQLWEVDLSRHVLAFSLAALIRLRQPTANSPFLLLGLCLALVLPPWPQFAYAALALMLLSMALRGCWSESRMLQSIASHVYEYFLLHGIFLVGAVKLLPAHPFLALTLGFLSSLVGAYLLKRAIGTVIVTNKQNT